MTSPSVHSLRPSQLSDTQREQWQAFVDDHSLKTPLLQPEFIFWCAQYNTELQILCIEDGNNRAFLPVNLNENIASEFIGRLSDFCGPVTSKGYAMDSRAVLRSAGLSALHLNTSVIPLNNATLIQTRLSPYIDLGSEKDQWLTTLKQKKSSTLNSTQRKARKMIKEVGPLRFELHSDSHYAMQCLVDWKGAQRDRTATVDVFQTPWVSEMLHSLPTYQSSNFRGALSCLYAGDELVAVHLGLHSNHTLHWWLTTYNPKFQKYSPGANLLIELCKAAQDHGLSRIDLGFGEERYKTSFKNGDSELYSYISDASLGIQLLRKAYRFGIQTVKHSPLEATMRSVHKRLVMQRYKK